MLLLLAAPACKPPAQATEAPLSPDTARRRATELERHLAKNPADDGAALELAHLQWLHLRGAAKAVPTLDRLAAKGDPIAQMSRMLIADARLDLRKVRDMAQALILGVAKLDRKATPPELLRTRIGLAELAARYLGENHGELPDDDADFQRFFAEASKLDLPLEVSQPLLSLRANLARRLDQPYLGYYDAQGCVRAWQVGALEGHLEAFELRRAAADPSAFVPDPKATLTTLSCAVRTWNPARRAGIRRMRTYLNVPGEQLTLNLSAQEAVRAYLDGAPIHRSDRSDRWPTSDTTVQLQVSPGVHRLDVHTAMPRDKAWVLVRATDHLGKAVPAAATPATVATPFTGQPGRQTSPFFPGDRGPLAGPSYAPLRMFLAASDALADGNSDDAEGYTRALRRVGPDFAEGHVLIAAFEIGDPSRERAASTARQRAAIERALALDPGLDRARVRLLELGLERGETSEVLDAIAGLGKDALHHVPGELLRYQAFLTRGNEHLADAALARAAALHPDHCAVLKAQRGVAQRRGDVVQEDALTAKVERCPGTTGSRARLAARRGRRDEARTLLKKLLERTPDDVEVMTELADLAISEGKLEEALAYRRQILALSPYAVGVEIAIADLQARAGDPEAARRSIDEALGRVPQSMDLRQIASAVGVPDDLAPYRVDGIPIVQAYRAGKHDYDGVGEVLVLDRSVTRVYPDGSQRHIVHTIAELRSKEAIDQYGEITPREGSRVLTLHTIKPDGRVFEPESIPEKDGLSLRGLQIGDIVEYEYMFERDELGLLPGYVDLSTFRFQSPETPFHISEMIVVAPSTMPLKAELRAGAPQAKVERRGDLTIQHWRVDRSPRLGVEPQMRSSLHEVPNLRVYNDVDTSDWLAALGLRLYTAQRSNLELRQLTRKIVAGQKTPRARLAALHRWVVENIEEVGDLQIPATLTLSVRKGGGLMLLKSMLREAGLRAELWLARDNFGPTLEPGGNPMFESYDSPYLAVWTGEDEPTMVITGSKVLPLGYLLPGLSGARALRVPLVDEDPPAGPVQLPLAAPALRDRRSYRMNLELLRDGTGRVEGTIELQGMEAAAWRDVLRNLDRDRINDGFERAELAVLFPGATVELADLQIEHEKDLELPLRLVFSGGIRGALVEQGGELLMRAATVPLNVGLGYTTLPTRKTGYAIPYAPALDAVVQIAIEGAKFTGAPSAENIQNGLATYTRAVKVAPGGASLEVHTTASLKTGVFEPTVYPRLSAVTREIKAAEEQVIRAR
jgi:tetratricopeptide (TPR) repeat protein